MKYSNLSRRKYKLDLNAIIVYFIMFFSNDSYLFGTNSNEAIVSFSRYLMIFSCVVFLFMMRFKIDLKNNKQKILAYLLVLIMYLVIGNINHELPNRLIIKVLCITVALLQCMALSFDQYANAFRKAMYFISITTIGFTAIAYIMPGLVRMFPYVINTAGSRIYTVGVAGLLDSVLGQVAVRSQGIFWEPGVLQIYLNVAIAFELFYIERINRKYLTAYFIALILTFSTTGFIVVAWLLVCFVILKKSRTTTALFKKFAAVSVGFWAAVIIFQFTEFGDVVFGKMINPTSSGTAMVRLAGVLTNIEIALLNPWHGCGMENINAEFLRLTIASKYILGFTEQNTNTLLYQFAAHGIPYGIVFTMGTFKFGNCFNNGKKIITISIFIMFVLMYIGENLQYSSLPYIVIFYGFGWKEELKRAQYKQKGISHAVQAKSAPVD